VGSVLEKRLLKMTGGSTTMKNDGLHNKSFLKKKTAIHRSFCSEPSMGMQSHASSDSELHSEEDGMA